MSPTHTVTTALIIAAAGVPLGFSIYQIYFLFRWNSPFSRDGLLPPLITGRMSDLALVLRDIKPKKLKLDKKWRKKWIKHSYFNRDHGYRWRYMELLFREAAQCIDSNYSEPRISDRHSYLHEIVHTLGASIVSVFLGFIGYLAFEFFNNTLYKPQSQYFLVTALFIIALSYFLNLEIKSKEWKLTTNDGLSSTPIPAIDWKFKLKNKQLRLLIISPASIFVYFLGILQVFLSPALNPTPSIADFIIRLLLISVFCSVWIISGWKKSKEFISGDAFLLILSSLIAIILRKSVFDTAPIIDWAFLAALYVFVVTNFILIQNRSNANNDLLALEYYTLRRYISEEKKTTEPQV